MKYVVVLRQYSQGKKCQSVLIIYIYYVIYITAVRILMFLYVQNTCKNAIYLY